MPLRSRSLCVRTIQFAVTSGPDVESVGRRHAAWLPAAAGAASMAWQGAWTKLDLTTVVKLHLDR